MKKFNEWIDEKQNENFAIVYVRKSAKKLVPIDPGERRAVYGYNHPQLPNLQSIINHDDDWEIVPSGRKKERPSTPTPLIGIGTPTQSACKSAGVPYQKVYSSKGEAQKDADMLNKAVEHLASFNFGTIVRFAVINLDTGEIQGSPQLKTTL